MPGTPRKMDGPWQEMHSLQSYLSFGERKEKETAKKKKDREIEAKVPSKVNGWDWPKPQPKLKDKRNKIAPAERKGGKANHFTVQ